MSLGCQKPLQTSTLLNRYLLSPASYLATEQQANLESSPVFTPCPLKSLPTVWDETTSSKPQTKLSWAGIRTARQLQARGFQAHRASVLLIAKGTSASQLSTFAQENSTSRSRASAGKRQVFQTAQADRTVPRVPGWRTLPLQQSVRGTGPLLPLSSSPCRSRHR